MQMLCLCERLHKYLNKSPELNPIDFVIGCYGSVSFMKICEEFCNLLGHRQAHYCNTQRNLSELNNNKLLVSLNIKRQ